MDEKQIENLQQGLAVKEMFYEVPNDESEGNVYGISYYGTIELAKLIVAPLKAISPIVFSRSA